MVHTVKRLKRFVNIQGPKKVFPLMTVMAVTTHHASNDLLL